jgi:hypothetical protein
MGKLEWWYGSMGYKWESLGELVFGLFLPVEQTLIRDFLHEQRLFLIGSG